MRRASGIGWALLLGAALHCGGAEQTLLVERRTEGTIVGSVSSGAQTLEFRATSSGELLGSVALRMGELTYDFEYDYAAGRVSADGHGRGVEREAQRFLAGAVQMVSDYLGPEGAELPFQEQMLYAALATWQEAGGMRLSRREFLLEPALVEKSLGDNGVSCIRSGLAYFTSFDYGDTVVLDRIVTAGEADCNGMCGPTCTQLQPWKMWTLDCLEHDECCRDTSADTCWTPLGECGDEYFEAQTDFLRGFDPFRRHCGG